MSQMENVIEKNKAFSHQFKLKKILVF